MSEGRRVDNLCAWDVVVDKSSRVTKSRASWSASGAAVIFLILEWLTV